MANVYGYARVSTKHQNEDRQVQALKEYGITNEDIFVDKESGKDFNREEYQLMKKILKRTQNQNNVLVVKSIDRLGRNYKQIQEEWREITQELNADIIVLDMPLLDSTKFKDLLGNFISDLILQVLAFVAEQERTNIKQRQSEGIALALAKGKQFGRPRIPVPENFEEEIIRWKKGEQTARACMTKLNLKAGTFYNMVKSKEVTRK